MDQKTLTAAATEIGRNRSAALATITAVTGSVPQVPGAMMCVREDGSIEGTVGGGKLEAAIISDSLECIKKGESRGFTYDLTENGLHMECGGRMEVFIKVMKKKDTLVLFGGGHIALELADLAGRLGYHLSIYDDREEFCNPDRFPQAGDLHAGDLQTTFDPRTIDGNTYIIIITRGHTEDEKALRLAIDTDAVYVGMIGSKRKVRHIMDAIAREKGMTEQLEKFYSPIGLDLGGDTPAEIALAIMAEVQLIRKKGTLTHLKDKKKAVKA